MRCVGWLSTYRTQWTRAEDKKLQRLVSFIKASLGKRQIGFIGDPLNKCKLSLYSDSDFAGDRRDMKSTSGGVLVLTGPHTFFPLGPFCKKQTRTSHSSTEAEIVALDRVLVKEGYPALDLWDVIFKGICGRPVDMEVFEDNQAASRVVKTGKSQELRHVHRVHGVSIRALHEAWQESEFSLKDCHTMAQAADIFTKGFTSRVMWNRVSQLIGMVDKEFATDLLKRGAVKKPVKAANAPRANAGVRAKAGALATARRA